MFLRTQNSSLTAHYRQAKGNSQNLSNIATRLAGRQTQPRAIGNFPVNRGFAANRRSTLDDRARQTMRAAGLGLQLLWTGAFSGGPATSPIKTGDATGS